MYRLGLLATGMGNNSGAKSVGFAFNTGAPSCSLQMMAKARVLLSSAKALAPVGEGGGETIAHDLLNALGRLPGLEVEALGAFRYQDLDPLAQALVGVGKAATVDNVWESIDLGHGSFAFPRLCHVRYRLSETYQITLARADHYFRSWRQKVEELKPMIMVLQAEGAVECWAHGLPLRGTINYFYVLNSTDAARFAAFSPNTPRFLALSRFVQKKMWDEHRLESELLYPAVEIERYKSRESPPAHRTFTILFINPVPPKGLAIALELAERLRDIDFIFLEGWRPARRELVSALSFMPNVRLERKTWDMAAVYPLADLLIVPSVWDEVFGRVVVEAHAAGVPTLASCVGGLPEASGEPGLLVADFTNPGAWESEIRAIVHNPALLPNKEALFSNASRFAAAKAARKFAEISGLELGAC